MIQRPPTVQYGCESMSPSFAMLHRLPKHASDVVLGSRQRGGASATAAAAASSAAAASAGGVTARQPLTLLTPDLVRHILELVARTGKTRLSVVHEALPASAASAPPTASHPGADLGMVSMLVD